MSNILRPVRNALWLLSHLILICSYKVVSTMWRAVFICPYISAIHPSPSLSVNVYGLSPLSSSFQLGSPNGENWQDIGKKKRKVRIFIFLVPFLQWSQLAESLDRFS